MPTKPKPIPHNHYHKDGTLWATGQMLGDLMVGYWEFFRKDGTRLRSGNFASGEQIGDWTTYDKQGRPYKITTIKPQPKNQPIAKKSPPAKKVTNSSQKNPSPSQEIAQAVGGCGSN